MTFSALYVLPVLALLILIQRMWVSARSKNMHRSRKNQRKAQHRNLFFRALIVALLVATALTMTWPLPHLSEIVQAVMLTVAIMTPFCVYIVINKLWPQQTLDKNMTEESFRRAVDTPDLRPAPSHTVAEESRSSRRRRGQRKSEKQPAQKPEESEETMQVSLQKSLDELFEEPPEAGQTESVGQPPKETELPGAPTAESRASTSLHSQSSEQESALDQTLSVGEQMETLDDLVDFHDIGDYEHEHQLRTGEADAPPAYNPLEKAIAVARDAILEEPGIQDHSTENLPAKSRIELSEMVVRLRSDKMKLQKLVIAQKAVIDSEKQAHERTRVVVKDAISVMRHARHGQRIAEKIARRERAERQRMEKDYVKVRRALDNALSTLNTKSGRKDVEEA